MSVEIITAMNLSRFGAARSKEFRSPLLADRHLETKLDRADLTGARLAKATRENTPYNLRAEEMSEEHEQRRIVPGYTDQVIIYSENQAEK